MKRSVLIILLFSFVLCGCGGVTTHEGHGLAEYVGLKTASADYADVVFPFDAAEPSLCGIVPGCGGGKETWRGTALPGSDSFEKMQRLWERGALF